MSVKTRCIFNVCFIIFFFLHTSRNEVVNKEGWCVAVFGCKQFAVRRRVREGDFFLGEVTAVHKGAPANRKMTRKI